MLLHMVNYFDGINIALSLEKNISAGAVNGAKLLIIQIGTNPASEKYIKLKKSLCSKYGIPCEVVWMKEDLSDGEIGRLVTKLVTTPENTGVIVQLPLPRPSLYSLLSRIPLAKDVDVLNPESKKLVAAGRGVYMYPVVRAFETFLKYSKTNDAKFIENNSTVALDFLRDKTLGIVGGGELVGKPISFFSSKKFKTVDTLENYTSGTPLNYDYLVLSAGIPNLVNPQDISPGSCVVDFGSSVFNGKTVGDLDISKPHEHLNCLSKSPGGMGPLVVRYLVLNLLHL